MMTDEYRESKPAVRFLPRARPRAEASIPSGVGAFFLSLKFWLGAYALTLILVALFAVWLSRATAEDQASPVKDKYPETPDCDMYRGLPDQFLDCVYPRPA